MQPRQFRNYPMPHNAGAPNEVVNIADLDIIQKVKGAGDKVEEIADDKIQGDWKRLIFELPISWDRCRQRRPRRYQRD